jgi:RNA polymerase sigma factor (sigma-70 family)
MASEGFLDLVRRAQAGDRKAMDEALSILRPYLSKIASSYADPVRPVMSTRDLLQDSVLRAWKNLESFEGGENDDQTYEMFKAWLGQIVRRLGRNALRDRKAKRRTPSRKILRLVTRGAGKTTTRGGGMDVPAPGPTPSVHARTDEHLRLIDEALERVGSETDGDIVRMHYFQGLSLPEVSRKLEMEYNYVRERCRIVIGKLQRELKGLL